VKLRRIFSQCLRSLLAALAAVLASAPAFADRGFFEFTRELSYMGIAAQDTASLATATISSTLIPGMRASWRKSLGPRLSLGVAARARWVSLGALPGKTTSGASQFLTGAALEARFRLTRFGTVLLAGGGSESKLFVYAPSATAITVEPLRLFSAEGGLKQRVFKVRGFVFHLQGTWKWISSGTGTGYEAKRGSGWTGSLLFDRRISGAPLVWTGGVFYGKETQSTTLLKHEMSELGIQLGVRF
jgi:hypothetical protein